jgi:hydrogenase expression/formation protein HypE
MIGTVLRAAPGAIHAMKDPTRGGVASALHEMAEKSGVGILVREAAVPVTPTVRAVAEMLGLDPLHIANEGQLVAVVAGEAAGRALDAVRRVPGGEGAALIGRVDVAPARTVIAAASYGGTRVVDMLVGDPLPRIC